MQGWGLTEAGKEIQVPKEQEAGAAEQDLSSPISAPHPEFPFPTQISIHERTSDGFCFPWSHSPFLPHWQISLSTGGEGSWGVSLPSHPGVLGLLSTHPEKHQRLRQQGEALWDSQILLKPH